MSEHIDPRRISGALSMMDMARWAGQKRRHLNALQLVRLLTIDQSPRADWAGLSRFDVANWLKCGPNHARRVMDELVNTHRILARRPHAGNSPAGYRFRDPDHWRDFPWIFPVDPERPDRIPELVARRIEDCCQTYRDTREMAAPEVVARFQAGKSPARQFVAPPQAGPRVNKIRLPRDSGRESARQPESLLVDSPPGIARQIKTGPSSSDAGGAGDVGGPNAREKTEEAGYAGTDDQPLTGAAEEVRLAILRTGMGPVKGKIKRKLAEAFAGIHAEMVGPIVAAMARAAAGGQRPPAMVDLAVQMLGAGADRMPEVNHRKGRPPDVILGEQIDHAHYLRECVAEASAEGNAEMVEIFTRQLAACEDRIARMTGEPV